MQKLTGGIQVLFPVRLDDYQFDSMSSTDFWVCEICTLHNPNKNQVCLACSTIKPKRVGNKIRIRVQPKKTPTITNQDIQCPSCHTICNIYNMICTHCFMDLFADERPRTTQRRETLKLPEIIKKGPNPEVEQKNNLGYKKLFDQSDNLTKNIPVTAIKTPAGLCMTCTYQNIPEAQTCQLCQSSLISVISCPFCTLQNDSTNILCQGCNSILTNTKRAMSPQICTSSQNSKKMQKPRKEMIRDKLIQYQKENSLFCSLTINDIDQMLEILGEYETKPVLTTKNIYEFAKQLQGTKFSQSRKTVIDYLLMVDWAFHHSSPDKHRLRDVQIIALLCFMMRPNRMRTVLQILTGEGKSTTVACLAAILTVSGLKVDVVTTSQLLAERDVEEQASFFKLMGISTAHNFEHNQRTPKECYSGLTVVYGTPHSYQCDILFDEYKKRGTRNKRPYQVVIVDEVDSMFIDQKSQQTLISSVFPGYEELQQPMRLIWSKVNRYAVIPQENGSFKVIIPDGDRFIQGPFETIVDEIVEGIRNQFGNNIIPEWRLEFVELSKKGWIRSAIRAAFTYKKDVNYAVKGGKIVPIDNKNTGCFQDRTHLNHGLHQFLQMKHGLTVTTQGMTSNFISNIAHFDKYPQIYGLTGTLGSAESKRFLKSTYDLELFEVPPFSERRLRIEEGEVLYDTADWVLSIIKSCKEKCEQGRSVLVIFESIRELELVEHRIRREGCSFQTYTLKAGDERLPQLLESNCVILATNLAGRGTDIKISKSVQAASGLHVIMSFMPSNSRVEMQGRGRAGRNGAPGSGQLKLDLSEYFVQYGMESMIPQRQNFSWSQFKSLRLIKMHIRDRIERGIFQSSEYEVSQIRFQDKLFNKYCQRVGEISDFLTSSAKALAIEEQWAMYLKRQDLDLQKRGSQKRQWNKKQENNLILQAQKFLSNLVKNSESFYNPHHIIRRGIELVKNPSDAIKIFAEIGKSNAGVNIQIGAKLLEEGIKISANNQDRAATAASINALQQLLPEITIAKDLVAAKRIFDKSTSEIARKHQRVAHQEFNHVNQQIQIRQCQQQSGASTESKILKTQISPFKLHKINQPKSCKDTKFLSQEEVKQCSDSAESRVLEAIQSLITSYADMYKSLGQKQYMVTTFKPITDLVDTMPGNRKENLEALEKISVSIPGVPFPQKRKAKIPWWKRPLVFVAGVVQVVGGLLIVAATCGACFGLGSSMIMNGVKSIYHSIFKPEMLADLGKYFTEKALGYAVTLATSGESGIKQLVSMGRNGFQYITSNSLMEIVKGTGRNVVAGANKLFNNARLLIKSEFESNQSSISKSLIEVITKGQSVNFIRDVSLIRQQVQKGYSAEKNNINKSEAIVKEFLNASKALLQQMIRKNQAKFLVEMNSMTMIEHNIRILISNGLEKEVNADNTDIVDFFAKNYNKPNLAELFFKFYDIEGKLISCLKKIHDSSDYAQLVEEAIQGNVLSSINKVRDKLVSEFNSKAERSRLRDADLQFKYDYLSTEAYNAEVGVFNQEIEAIKAEQIKLQPFLTYLQQFPGKVSIYKQLAKQKIFKDARVDGEAVKKSTLPEQIKDILLDLKPQSNKDTFETVMETKVYNCYIANAVSSLHEALENMAGGTSSEFSSKIRELL